MVRFRPELRLRCFCVRHGVVARLFIVVISRQILLSSGSQNYCFKITRTVAAHALQRRVDINLLRLSQISLDSSRAVSLYHRAVPTKKAFM